MQHNASAPSVVADRAARDAADRELLLDFLASLPGGTAPEPSDVDRYLAQR